jgi:hypothetical protein
MLRIVARPLLGFAVVAALAAPAYADDGCKAIGWSVQREQVWFADKKLPHRPLNARMSKIDRAVDLTLKPVKQVQFFLAPAKKPKAGTFAGLITFLGVPKPGVYQITLSQPADVDVFENGARIKPSAVALAPQCPEARASARFDLGTGESVLVQVSGAAAAPIKVAFAAAP